MLKKPRCPACGRDGAVQMEERKLRGVMRMTYGFHCIRCGYEVQNTSSQDELLERIREDKYKIESLSTKPKDGYI
ncbi:MAG: hypothetical protein FWG94_11175 [Oscillospiraceae bacterium]|nr:hypothetical protein [Oscillospiraceae bacterium]